MTKYRLIGKQIPRMDAAEKVTGRLRYVADVKLPGMLYGKLLRSSYPHARILGIDTGAAERHRGVLAVITGRDMPQKRHGHLVNDLSFLPLDKVRYLGEPVAAVAAMDEAAAEEAIQLIQVEYQELPTVSEEDEAIREHAPILHEELAQYEVQSITTSSPLPVGNVVPGTNICYQLQLRAGDVEEGFREADRIVEETFRVPMVHHAPMETHGAVADVTLAGHVTIWTCTQGISRLQRWLAEYFDLPQSMVRIIGMKAGGGFGSKIAMTLEPYCVALSKRAGRPVRIILTRDEEFISIGGWVPGTFRFKTGVKNDGRLVARQVSIRWNAGAHSYTSPVATAMGALVALGPYRVPNVQLESSLVYTNRPGSRPWRGLAATQANWAVERHTDSLARSVSMDPLEFRLKNCFETGDATPWGEVLEDVRLRECLLSAADTLGWGKAKGKPCRGRGIASLWKWTVPGFISQALVKVFEDGSVQVITGTPDIGTGSEVVLAQIAGEVLSVPLERIRVYGADSDAGLFDYGASASRSAVYSGNAVLQAARAVREQILQLASRHLQVPLEELELGDERVFLKGKSETSVPLARVLRGQSVLMGSGAFRGEGQDGGHRGPGRGTSPEGGWAFADWKFGAAAAEVEVDPETGATQVTRIVAAHDIGRVLNRLNVETQVHGSVVMGLGAALTEHMAFDGGRLLNPSFMEYIMLTALEAPREIIPVLLEPGTGVGPYGAKGFGELPVVAVPAAVGNAVADAVGVEVRDLPITPEKVLMAMEGVERQDS
ncbi:MAG: xanthine dehydrogenase family protein molybdopterin-binding subunit [Candidatus Rokubacteria bacterium]|nr:xanthine dehydrogenase family protein molybdopterin-binding subunit [Candidatus Rokubacteria bacterium]